MTRSEIEKMIKDYNIRDCYDGRIMVSVNRKLTPQEDAKIRLAKPEILAYFAEKRNAEKAEREAKEKATIRFIVPGWEFHEASVDTRYNIDEQLKKIAEYYSQDTTLDLVREAYEKAVKAKKEEEIKKAEEENKIKAIFEKAKETGEKQVLRKYMAECDGTVCECTADYITVWAMPDGSTTKTRIHAY